MMPRLDGYGVLRAAARDSHLASHAYVLLTAYSNQWPPEFERVWLGVSVLVVPKPFELNTLLDMVAEACKPIHG